jgi:hypothetical protein
MFWTRILALCLFTGLGLTAETRDVLEHPRPGARPSKLWRISVVALAASSSADAWSSYGRHEMNPLLRSPDGRFSGKAIGIKAAIAGSGVVAQWLMLRHRPESAKAAALTNFGMAGIFTGVAVRNRSQMHNDR